MKTLRKIDIQENFNFINSIDKNPNIDIILLVKDRLLSLKSGNKAKMSTFALLIKHSYPGLIAEIRQERKMTGIQIGKENK